MILPRLRELREDNDLTQTQLAGYLCVAQRTYSSYERGESNISLELLIKLTQYYGVSLNYIIGLTNER